MTTVLPAPKLGPNDRQPCPSRGARVRHRARAEHCPTCHVEGAVTPDRPQPERGER